MKRTPLKRKTSLKRTGWGNRLRDKKKSFLRRTPLRKISQRERIRKGAYWPAREEHLRDHPFCEFCRVLNGRKVEATEVHHKLGRVGKLLTDRENFISSCQRHRLWPHENPVEASRLGWMPPEIATRAEYREEMKKQRKDQ